MGELFGPLKGLPSMPSYSSCCLI